MNYWEIAGYLLLASACLASPIFRDAVYFILWPIRLPILLVGYLFMWVNYLLLTIFDPRSVDILYAGCVQDGVTKNFFQRVWLSLKLSFIQRSRYFKGCFGLREQGFLRATIGQVGFESRRERMEIAEDESQEILAKYLKSRSHVDDLVNSENLLRDKMKELNEYEKKSGKPLSKWKYPF